MFSFNLYWICRITVEKLSIIRIYAQFDPLFGPLKADNCVNNENYLSYTIRVYLKWTPVMFFLICFKFAESTWRKCPNSAFLPNFPHFLPPKVRKFALVMNLFHTFYLYDIALMIRNVSHRTGHRKVHKQGTDINN